MLKAHNIPSISFLLTPESKKKPATTMVNVSPAPHVERPVIPRPLCLPTILAKPPTMPKDSSRYNRFKTLTARQHAIMQTVRDRHGKDKEDGTYHWDLARDVGAIVKRRALQKETVINLPPLVVPASFPSVIISFS